MKSRVPASTAPTGAPSPLERSIQTVSNGARSRRPDAAGDDGVHAAARRPCGPSCRARWRPRAPRESSPAARSCRRRGWSCLLDHDRRERGAWRARGPDRRAHLLGGEDAAVAVDRAEHDPGERGRRRPFGDGGWASRRGSPRRPAAVHEEAIALHIVPDGRKRAASLPSSSATRSCRRLTVGSSAAARRRPRPRPWPGASRASAGLGVAGQIDHAGTSSAAAARACIATGSLRSHTAVSWNAAPPFGAPGSALTSELTPIPPSNAELGQSASTTMTPRWTPSNDFACRRNRAAGVADFDALAGFNFQLCAILGMDQHGRPPLAFARVGVSVNVLFKNLRAGAVTRRNGVLVGALVAARM